MTLISISFYIGMLVIITTGIFLMGKKKTIYLRKRKYLIERIKAVGKTAYEKESTGLQRTYNTARHIIFISLWITGIIQTDMVIIWAAFIIYLLMIPKEKIAGLTTIYGFILGQVRKHYQERMDYEIYNAMSILKNIMMIQINESMGADYIITQIAEYSTHLKGAYYSALKHIRLNEKEKAIEALHKKVGSKISKDFARLLIQMDEINPSELLETLLLYQKNIREERLTKEKQKNEVLSDILYIPAVINAMAVLMNFIIITYFMDQQEMFQFFI